MSNVIKHQPKSAAIAQTAELTPEQRDVLTRTGIIPKGCPDHVVALFGEMCRRQGIDPFSKSMHIVPFRKNDGGNWITDYAVVVGIHAIEQRAASTGKYAGIDEVVYNRVSDTEFDSLVDVVRHFRDTKEYPISCHATAYRFVGGQRVAFSASVLFDEYAQTNREGRLIGNWSSKPFFMIAKCARAAALRMAFPETAGLYAEDEIGAYSENITTARNQADAEASRQSMIGQAYGLIRKCTTQTDFTNLLDKYPHFEETPEIVRLIQDRKNEIKQGFINRTAEQIANVEDLESLEKLWNSNPKYAELQEIKELFQNRHGELTGVQTEEE